jgi:Tol biopolymer transport system component
MENDGSHPRRILRRALHLQGGYSASPSDRLITYARQEGKGRFAPYGIWAMRPDGTRPRRLLGPFRWGGEQVSLGAPVWAPDGRRFAFSARFEDSFREAIFVADADGTNVRMLVPPTDDYVGYPAWSSLGTIAFFRDGWIRTIKANGSSPRRLVRQTYDGYSWSPEGRRLVYIDSEGSGIRLSIVDAEGHNRRSLLIGGSHLDEPLWAPTGEDIAFADAREDGRREIYVIRADGTKLRRLTNNRQSEEGLFWIREQTG